jgi:RHS repeat-associated protein
MKHFFFCLFFLSTLTAHASEPGSPGAWQFAPPPNLKMGVISATMLSTDALQTSNQQDISLDVIPPQQMLQSGMQVQALTIGSEGDIAAAITPEITALATSLQNDPLRIFEYVYNNIAYEHYYGSKKGAQLTLLEGSGNDMDQSALFVALLRAAGHQAHYARIWQLIPYDDAPLCAVSWLGLDANPYPNLNVTQDKINAGVPNWSDLDFKRTLLLFNYFRGNGFDYESFADFPGGIAVRRTVVYTTINNMGYLLDPSVKALRGQSDGVNLLEKTNFQKAAFYNELRRKGAAGDAAGTYLSRVDYGTVKNQVTASATSLTNWIRTNRPNDTVGQILGRGEIVPATIASINDVRMLQRFAEYGLIISPTITENLMSKLQIDIDNGTPKIIPMPALRGETLSVSCDGTTVQVRQGDTIIHTATAANDTFKLKMMALHPNITDHSAIENNYKRTGSYALIYGFNVGKNYLNNCQKTLDIYYSEAQKRFPESIGIGGSLDFAKISDATLKRKLTAESLNVMGVNWLYQTELTHKMAAAVNGMTACMRHRFGRMGQEEGFYIDVGLQYASQFPKTGLLSSSNAQAYIVTSSYFASALEHGIIDQYNAAPDQSVSTVQMFYLASISGDNNKKWIYRADKSSWATMVKSELQKGGYNATQLAEFEAKINAGATLFIPRHVDYSNANWRWKGSGYVEIAPSASGALSVVMAISGNYTYSGGWNIFTSFIDPTPIYNNFFSAPCYFDTGNVSYYTNYTPSAILNTPLIASAEPIDMRTGAYFYDKEDISIGQGGTRGLSFQRYYNSNRRDDNTAKLGHGWVHNYAMKAVSRTAPETTLGEGFALEAVPMLAAVTLINEIVRPDPLNPPEYNLSMVSGALVAKAAVDGLINNAVTVSIGKDSLQFTKGADGTYIPPTGSTMTLTAVGTTGYTLKERFGNTYTFDRLNGGRVKTIADLFGKTLTFTYDTNGLQKVADAYGRTLTFAYQNGLIKTLTDNSVPARTVEFTYDANKNLTTAQDPEGAINTFIYDDQHRLIQIKDPQNRILATNHYNADSQVVEQDAEGNAAKRWKYYFSGMSSIEIDPLGNTKTYRYDNRGRLISMIDALGNTSSLTYDGQDHIIKQVTPKGEVTEQEFDANHNLIKVKNPIGTETTIAYDALNRVTSTTLRAAGMTDRVTRLEYSVTTHNLPSRVIPQVGNATSIWYNTTGAAIGTIQKSQEGSRITAYSYDATYGTLASIKHPDLISEYINTNSRGDVYSTTDRKSQTTTFEYDKNRRLLKTTYPNNTYTCQTYDPCGNVATTTSTNGIVSKFTYTVMGKPVEQTLAVGTAEEATIKHTYDIADREIATIDPLGNQVSYAYDAAGRVTGVTNALGETGTTAYDANGQTIETKTPLGFTTRFDYNSLGAVTTTTDPASSVLTNTYNGFGERTNLRNRRNNNYVFTYDAVGRLISTKTPAVAASTTQTWNVERNLVDSVTQPSGKATSYTYDALGRTTQQSDPVGTIAFTYDNNSNPLKVTASGNNPLERTWDSLNRPLTYKNAAGEIISYAYNTAGQIEKITYPGGFYVQYFYTGAGRLQTVVDSTGRTTTYTWDILGRLTKLTRPNGTVRTNIYDALSRLVSFQERDATENLLAYASFGYDADGRLINRFRLPTPQIAATTPAKIITYDADNRITSFGSGAVTHDLDGNMTVGPLTTSASNAAYAYDARNRLTSVGEISYTYDAENNRIAQTVEGTGTTRYTIDPHGDALPRVLIRTKPDGTKTTYVYGIGLAYEIMEQGAQSTVRYYHYDQLGSTVALTDGTGTVTDRAEYDVYGQRTYRLGVTDTPFWYVGQFGVQLDTNGLLYMRARYYNPLLMRFINADPIGFSGGMNWYAYAGNSPLTLIDAAGLCPSSGVNLRVNTSIYDWLSSSPTRDVTYNFWYKELERYEPPMPPNPGIRDATMDLVDFAIVGGMLRNVAFNLSKDIVSLFSRSAAETVSAPAARIGATGAIGETALKSLGGESQVYFRTARGGRYIDQLVNSVAHESKVGYTSLTRNVGNQISKDVELIHTGQIEGSTWHFFQSPITGAGGPSAPLLETLQQSGINVIVH